VCSVLQCYGFGSTSRQILIRHFSLMRIRVQCIIFIRFRILQIYFDSGSGLRILSFKFPKSERIRILNSACNSIPVTRDPGHPGFWIGMFSIPDPHQRFDTIRYDTIRYDTIRYDTIRYITIRYDTIRYDTIRYDTIRYDTIRYDTIR